MQSYSQDLRDRVLWALDRGERPTAIARRLEVCSPEGTPHKLNSTPPIRPKNGRVLQMENLLRFPRRSA